MNLWFSIPISFVLAVTVSTSTAEDDHGHNIGAAFLKIWNRAESEPTAAIEIWKTFAKHHPCHDLSDVARLMIGIDLLRHGNDSAKTLPYFLVPGRNPDREESSPLHQLVLNAGRGLTARLRMQQLAATLQQHYRQHVEYPPKLDELVGAGRVQTNALIDPFGRPYEYEARSRPLLPALPRQTYRLRCVSIEAGHHDLSAALARASEPIRGVRASRLEGYEDRVLVRALRPDGAPARARVWRIGRKVSGLVLWAVYDNWILVAREQFPRPCPLVPRTSNLRQGLSKPAQRPAMTGWIRNLLPVGREIVVDPLNVLIFNGIRCREQTTNGARMTKHEYQRAMDMGLERSLAGGLSTLVIGSLSLDILCSFLIDHSPFCANVVPDDYDHRQQNGYILQNPRRRLRTKHRTTRRGFGFHFRNPRPLTFDFFLRPSASLHNCGPV